MHGGKSRCVSAHESSSSRARLPEALKINGICDVFLTSPFTLLNLSVRGEWTPHLPHGASPIVSPGSAQTTLERNLKGHQLRILEQDMLVYSTTIHRT